MLRVLSLSQGIPKFISLTSHYEDLALMNGPNALWTVVIVAAIGIWILARTAAAGCDAEDLLPLNCMPFANTVPPKAAPQNDPDAIERFQVINREVRAGSSTVLFLGDSLTQKWDRSLWEQYFAPLNVLNAGVNGDRTEHLLWRIQHGNIDAQHVELVVLLIGTNDVGRDRPASMTAEGVRQILGVLQSRLPSTRILLLGLLPRSELPGSERRRQVKEVNRLIRTCADWEHIFYLDIGDLLLDRTGQLTREVSPDGVHLSKYGYVILTGPLELELRKMLSLK